MSATNQTGFSPFPGHIPPAGETIRVYFSHSADGFSSWIVEPAGTTLGGLFDEKVGSDASRYFIRVRTKDVTGRPVSLAEEDVTRAYVLKDGDQVSVVPAKIEGAVEVGYYKMK